MDFKTTFNEEAESFRKQVVDFLTENVPNNAEFPAESEELDAKSHAFGKVFRQKLAEQGWLYPTWPEEYGEAGLSWEKRYIIEEEILKRNVPRIYDLGRLLGAALIIKGNEDQKKRILPLIGKGEVVVWQCFTEPEAGSDLASLSLQSIRKGNEFILNGQKVYTGDGHTADYLYVLAITDREAPRHHNMTAFFVKADSPGITYDALTPLAFSRKNVAYFENVHVPTENVIGEVNKGWSVANASLEAERGGWGDWFRLEDLFIKTLEYCHKAKRGGRPLTEEPESRELLFDLYQKTKKPRNI